MTGKTYDTTGMPPESILKLAELEIEGKIKQRAAVTQGVATTLVGLIVLTMTATSGWLIINNKELPDFFSTTIAIAITGLVSLLSYQAGKAEASK